MNAYEREHGDLVRRLAPECTVLLRSSGVFPLECPCDLALFGSGARHTVKGGTGSGEVNSRYFVTVEQGLENAGFRITSKFWLDSYDEILRNAKKAFLQELKKRAKEKHSNIVMEYMGAVMPEPEYCIPMKAAGNTAVYVLSRISGEGNDRGAVHGDILLSETEMRDILWLQEHYEKFLLVLNVGGPVDLSGLDTVEDILLLGQLGAETGNICADLILGKSYPSGKLSTTWADWTEYCDIADFGDINETRYREGVYVGYRWFDAVAKAPRFPFGFGLSYTQFSRKVSKSTVSGDRFSLEVKLRNTGKRAGKEILQLYVSALGGKLDKPVKELAAFRKSDELQPDAEQRLIFGFSLRDCASYDEERSAWVLEAGDYVIRLGTGSTDTEPIAVLRLEKEVITRKVRKCAGKPDFTDWKPSEREPEPMPDVPVYLIDASAILTETVAYDREYAREPETASLSDRELALLNVGAFDPKGGITSVIGEASSHVAGAAGETADAGKGFPVLIMADGPAGIRISREYFEDGKGVHSLGSALPASIAEVMPAPVKWLFSKMEKKPAGEIKEQNATAIPIGTGLAQSWNLALVEELADMVGSEMERFGIQLWLAPALNIHRSIRCGRNFEYYSEDPLLSGKMAAAVTRGVQKHRGCGTTIKHFAVNNQETNRYTSNSQVNERALREIYLRGFEICVRESQPHALMTSYNLLNGVHTSERRDLTEDILRCEFGYQGIVMTDWLAFGLTPAKGSFHRVPKADLIAAAGSDLVMPGSSRDVKEILEGLKTGALTREQLEINASRVLRKAKELNQK
ncbi:MAG: glycoside hydrolase family 3 C-terminal domain-containing protein [Oscillospiraceae bacterium]|nr:glycoside hydrolase family 3 C-terminal domain-containing protein [Oscillospiraceae bacterium]